MAMMPIQSLPQAPHLAARRGPLELDREIERISGPLDEFNDETNGDPDSTHGDDDVEDSDEDDEAENDT